MWASGVKASSGIAAASLNVVRTTGSGNDWEEGALTTDGTYRDLDLSSIVPAGTTQVQLRVRLYNASLAYHVVYFRKKGETNGSVVVGCFTYDAGKEYDHTFWLSVDGDRKIQYSAQSATWDMLEIVVKAWMVAAS